MKRAELLSILTTVSRALDKNNVIPIYEYICFTGDTVFAFSEVIGIVAPFKVKQPFAVHGPTFMKLLQASVSDTIEMNVTPEGLLIQAGESEYTLPIKGPDEFVWKQPNITGTQLGSEIITGIRNCLPTCSENLALEAFNRICIKSYPSTRLNVYATDGDALTRYCTNIACEDNVDFCMSQLFCSAIKDAPDTSTITVDDKSEWIVVKTNDVEIYGPNLGPTTLDYEEQILKSLGDKSHSNMTPIPSKLLDQALSRARVVADIESAVTRFIVEKNEMLIQTLTPFGDVFDSVAVKHPNIEVDINAAIIQTCMQECTEFKLTKQSCLFTGGKILRLVSIIG